MFFARQVSLGQRWTISQDQLTFRQCRAQAALDISLKSRRILLGTDRFLSGLAVARVASMGDRLYGKSVSWHNARLWNGNLRR
jgi:hypothetical protein